MYNYAKANITINQVTFNTIENFTATARVLAEESLAHNTAKKALEETIATLVKEDKSAKAEQAELEALNEAWKTRNKELNFALFGGKVDGKKVNGICSLVTDDLYKAYVASVAEGKTTAYRTKIKDFLGNIIVEDTVKDTAMNHFINDIVMTMSSTKYNSNKNIAEGCAFITTINKRTYKKMFLGAIADVVANNHTFKIAKPKKDNGKKSTK